MRKLFEKCIKNNKGLSFVELICTIAIFSTVMTVVGGAMVVSANNYSRGNDESALQQEAQTTINLISNLVLDAVSVNYESGKLTITNNDSKYEIHQDGTELKYSQINFVPDGSGNIIPQVVGTDKVLAEGVVSFSADTSRFDTTKNVPITLGLESNSRTFTMTYNVTSRNGEKGGSAAGDFAYITINAVVLEPGEEYTFSNVSNKPVKWGSVNSGVFMEGDDISSCGKTSSDTKLTSSNASGATLKIGLGERAEKIVFRVQTQENSTETGLPLVYKDVTVYIRRVNKINLSGTVYTGVAKTSGAEYQVKASFANIENKNLRDISHAVNGSYNFREFENVTFTYDYNLESVANIVEEIGRVEDLADPAAISETNCNIKIKLKKDVPPGGKITITARANRPDAKGYQEVIGTYIIDNTGGSGPFHLPAGGLRRGTDDMTITFDYDSIRALVDGEGIKKTWRYRPMYTDAYGNITYGEWVDNHGAWLPTRDEGSAALKFNAGELNLMRPDLDYQIQIKAEIVGAGDNIVWPTVGTPEEEYMTTCTISHAQMQFSDYSPRWGETISLADGTVSIGSVSDPRGLYKGTEAIFHFDLVGGVRSYFESSLISEIYKWNNSSSSWEPIYPEIHIAEPYGDDYSSGQLRVKFDYEGKYKITFRWEVKDNDGNPLHNVSYSNEAIGEGFIYVSVSN